MPHGSGHHGGGGFHGGGHHHHHHFGHRHHHHHYGGRVWGYGYGYGGGSIIYRRPWSVFWTVLVIVVFVVVLTTSLSIRSANSSGHSGHGNIHASRDTSIVSYSNKFCDRLHIDGSGETAEQVLLTLYLLKSPPTDTRQEVIDFSKTVTVNHQYHYWLFHLLPGSKIKINACLHSGSSATFYFIKGVRNFEKWVGDRSSHYLKKLYVVDNCIGDNSNTFYESEVFHDDQYYMAFENKYGYSSLGLTFNIIQVLYAVSSDIVKDNCSVLLDSTDSCSLSVPYSSNYNKALLQLEPWPGSVVNWDANNDVAVKCHARGWLYAVICLFSAAGVILLVVGVAITCFVVHRHKKRRSTTINTDTSSATSATPVVTSDTVPNPVEPSAPEKDNVPLISTAQPTNGNPPPYNYNYNTVPPYKQ